MSCMGVEDVKLSQLITKLADGPDSLVAKLLYNKMRCLTVGLMETQEYLATRA